MAREILSIPEQYLKETISILRKGLDAEMPDVPERLRNYLVQWCDDEENYLKRLSES